MDKDKSEIIKIEIQKLKDSLLSIESEFQKELSFKDMRKAMDTDFFSSITVNKKRMKEIATISISIDNLKANAQKKILFQPIHSHDSNTLNSIKSALEATKLGTGLIIDNSVVFSLDPLTTDFIDKLIHQHLELKQKTLKKGDDVRHDSLKRIQKSMPNDKEAFANARTHIDEVIKKFKLLVEKLFSDWQKKVRL